MIRPAMVCSVRKAPAKISVPERLTLKEAMSLTDVVMHPNARKLYRL